MITLKEADEAAVKGRPVIYQGIVYDKIVQTGYRYTIIKTPLPDGDYREKIVRSGFVQLLDKNRHCVVVADPEQCILID